MGRRKAQATYDFTTISYYYSVFNNQAHAGNTSTEVEAQIPRIISQSRGLCVLECLIFLLTKMNGGYFEQFIATFNQGCAATDNSIARAYGPGSMSAGKT